MVAVFPPLARPISTPTPIASSSTPTPATASTLPERPPAGGIMLLVAPVGPNVAGVKRSRNWLRAWGWRLPHSMQ